MSRRGTWRACMLDGMRLQVEVRRDDEGPLRRMASDNGYSVLRLWASEFLHRKIQEEVARLNVVDDQTGASDSFEPTAA